MIFHVEPRRSNYINMCIKYAAHVVLQEHVIVPLHRSMLLSVIGVLAGSKGALDLGVALM
jgi:hypothetical protein